MSANFHESSHKKRWILTNNVINKSNRKDRDGLSDSDIENVFANESISLSAVGSAFNFRQRVVATALVYFRRFYVRASFVDFEPRLIAQTCLWLAAKVEESSVSNIGRFVDRLRTKTGSAYQKSDYLTCEFIVLDYLSFDLIVYHPYDLLQQYVQAANIDDKYLDSLWKMVNDAYFTDCALRHAPHVIALGCMLILAHSIQGCDLTDWYASLHVDQAAVWDVARRVLDFYSTQDRPSTSSLLQKLKNTASRAQH